MPLFISNSYLWNAKVWNMKYALQKQQAWDKGMLESRKGLLWRRKGMRYRNTFPSPCCWALGKVSWRVLFATKLGCLMITLHISWNLKMHGSGESVSFMIITHFILVAASPCRLQPCEGRNGVLVLLLFCPTLSPQHPAQAGIPLAILGAENALFLPPFSSNLF